MLFGLFISSVIFKSKYIMLFLKQISEIFSKFSKHKNNLKLYISILYSYLLFLFFLLFIYLNYSNLISFI